MGDEGLKRLNASGLTDAQKKKPEDLWKFFESQLKVNVNFRIHRLHLMQYRQKPSENIDEFVTRARTLALKCQFSDQELSERIIEFIIASTPYDGLRNELYDKKINCPLAEVLTEGRKYEALAAGKDQLQQLGMTSQEKKIDAVHRSRRCRNCDTVHQPRQCPAFTDYYKACGTKGHWAKCCRKAQQKKNRQHSGHRRSSSRYTYNRRQEQHGHRPHHRGSGQRSSSQKRYVDTFESDYETDGETFNKHFYSITISSKCLDSVDVKKSREEAFTTLDVQPPGLQGKGYTLRLKIDSGASSNTVPLRTLSQMYGKRKTDMLTHANGVKLTSYSGDEIPCLGCITMPCKYAHQRTVRTNHN